MAVVVKKFKIRSNKVEYNVGEIISDLSNEDEEKLIIEGYAEAVTQVDDGEGGDEDDDEVDILLLRVKEIEAKVKEMEDVDELNDLFDLESGGSKRKGVMDAIDSRVRELEGA